MKGDFIFQRHVKLRLRVLLNTIMFPEIEGGTLNQQKKKLVVLGKKSLGTPALPVYLLAEADWGWFHVVLVVGHVQ